MTNRNHLDVNPVADYFIASVAEQTGDIMTHLKLQKLCYLAQGWHLAYFGQPLFDNEIQAWSLGPVVVDLYQRFKKKNNGAITSADLMERTDSHFSDEQKEFLHQFWIKYGGAQASQLVELTHQHKTWIDAYDPKNKKPGEACNEVISIQAMKDYFLSLGA